MIDLGTVRPGSTIRIPFTSFDKEDGSSITMTNYAAADILVYKDGSTTERASTSGYTATTDFDAKTGKHLAIIDLADNTTAGFWAAGSEYLVAIDSVTIDSVTTGGWIARFRIGYQGAVLDTTIATLSTQTSFTLTSGPAEDDALNGMWAVIHDVASAVQFSKVLISDYTGSTRTVTLAAGATFTAAASDNFSVIDLAPVQPTVTGRTLDVSAGGEAGIDWANVGTPSSTVSLTNTTVATVTTTTTATNVTTVNGLAAGVITASSIAADAITAAKIADGAIDAATFAAGAINASAIASDAITAAKVAADVSAEIADAVWEEAIADHSGTAGSTAEQLAAAGAAGDPWATALPGSYTAGQAGYILGTNLNATVSSRATQTSVDTVDDLIDTEIAAIKTVVDAIEVDTQDIQSRLPAALVGGRIDANVGAISGDSVAADNAEAFFDGTGYAGTNNVIPTVTAVTTVNGLAANSVTASALAADAVAEIQSGLSTLDAAGVRSAVGLASANLDTQLDALPTAAEINAEVVDALSTDTYAEPGQGSPAATTTLAAKIGYLYKAWRNRSTQTSSEYALYADDGTTKDQEAAISDDGTTLVRGEVQTGA